MEGFLGETSCELADSPFAGFKPSDWALWFIGQYGQIDGEHHKLWVMDQVVRVLNGTPVLVSLAQWTNGQSEYRIRTGQPSQTYKDWVDLQRGDLIVFDDGRAGTEYGYDEGIPP